MHRLMVRVVYHGYRLWKYGKKNSVRGKDLKVLEDSLKKGPMKLLTDSDYEELPRGSGHGSSGDDGDGDGDGGETSSSSDGEEDGVGV
jgi:hypothetical protein